MRFNFLWQHVPVEEPVAEELLVLYMGEFSWVDEQENVSYFTVNIIPS